MPTINIVLNQPLRCFQEEIDIFSNFGVGKKETVLWRKTREWAFHGYGQYPHWGISHRLNKIKKILTEVDRGKNVKDQCFSFQHKTVFICWQRSSGATNEAKLSQALPIQPPPQLFKNGQDWHSSNKESRSQLSFCKLAHNGNPSTSEAASPLSKTPATE